MVVKQNKIMKKALFSVLCSFSVAVALAATDGPEAKKTKTASDSAKTGAPAPGFTLSGYMDTYYFANTNRPGTRSNAGVSGVARAFDQRAGQFGIGLVQGRAAYVSEHVDAVIDLAFGPFADLAEYGNVISLNAAAATSTSLAIKQAYLTWKATPKLSITAGQFATHIGYEVIDAPLNYNYSLSYLFNNGPFYHVGAKAQYAFSDRVYLMGGLVNGVDNLLDNNHAKGLIGQLFVSPRSGWNVYINAIRSNEANTRRSGADSTGAYLLMDLTTSYQLTPRWLLGFNAATGSQQGDFQGSGRPEKCTWGGYALYTHYDFTETFGIGVRAEHFDNNSGVRALRDADDNGTKVNSFTLTANITAADGHLLIKPEIRTDAFNKPQFADGAGELRRTQTTAGLAAIFRF